MAADIRLDNRAELLRRLGRQEADKTDDDAAIFHSAWSRWGEACLDMVAGDFALAVFDRRKRVLTLARDPTGQYPLFYSRNGADVAFASMPSGLRSLSADHGPHLATFAMHIYVSLDQPEHTIFEGIERVRPGELVRFSGQAVERKIYWQPQLHHPDIGRNGASDDDYVQAYRALLDGAVAARLPRNGSRVATHLSSGYDSSAVTATAARLLPTGSGPVAFTAAPLISKLDPVQRGRFGDESGPAAATARLHAIEHVVVRETGSLFDVVRRQSVLAQAPVGSAFNMAWWAEIRRRAHGLNAETLLTGSMGNLSLNAGGLSTLAAWARAGAWRHWWRESSAAARRSDVRWRGILVNSFGHQLPTSAIPWLRRRFLEQPSFEEISFLRAEWKDPIGRGAAEAYESDGDPYADRLHLIRTSDPGTLRKGALADCGVDESDPTADRRLIEFSLALPPEQLFRDGRSRPLARAALADRLPASLLDAHSRGMQAADWYHHFHQAEAYEVLEEISAHASVRDLLDLARMKRAIDDWPDRDWNNPRHIATYRISLVHALATGIFLSELARNPDSFGA